MNTNEINRLIGTRASVLLFLPISENEPPRDDELLKFASLIRSHGGQLITVGPDDTAVIADRFGVALRGKACVMVVGVEGLVELATDYGSPGSGVLTEIEAALSRASNPRMI
jgi:hypothetical protein